MAGIYLPPINPMRLVGSHAALRLSTQAPTPPAQVRKQTSTKMEETSNPGAAYVHCPGLRTSYKA
jgi:hypothetical protein